MKTVKGIEEFNQYFHQPTLHPYASVADLSRADLTLFEPLDFGMYCVVLMDEDFMLTEITTAGCARFPTDCVKRTDYP